MKSTIEIQSALLKAGFSLGPDGADGRRGPAYTKAVKAFQVSRGLDADGKVGTLTEAVLFPSEVPARNDDLPTFAPSPEKTSGPAVATRWTTTSRSPLRPRTAPSSRSARAPSSSTR